MYVLFYYRRGIIVYGKRTQFDDHDIVLAGSVGTYMDHEYKTRGPLY